MEYRRMNMAAIFLLALLIFFQYRLWFASGNILQMSRLKNQLQSEQARNDQLKARNQLLLLQIQQLQKNEDATESRARQELGMIKQGETFYQVVKE